MMDFTPEGDRKTVMARFKGVLSAYVDAHGALPQVVRVPARAGDVRAVVRAMHLERFMRVVEHKP